MSQFGEYTQLAGKSVRSLFYDGQKGTRDPVFEFVDYMNGNGGVGKQCVGSGYGCGPSTIRNIRLFGMQVIQKFFFHNQL